MTTLQYVGVLGGVWGLGVFVLSRRLSFVRSLDVACFAMLVYLLIMSAINDEYSVMHLV